mmetsp:Transcript_21385/g.58760  ORF Transcript_21385/g.58760 Transcript_21385/m.58760 type:complete len:206 (-) Transcript_21385:273-890(-)
MLKMDPRMKVATKAIIKLFQDNYPEMLSSKLFLNVPRVMEVVFNLMSSFSDPVTRAKFRMVSPGNARSVLLEYIPVDQLPTAYTGFEASPAPSDADDGPARLVGGEVKLKPGAPQEVTVDIPKAGRVTWQFVTRRDPVAYEARVVVGDSARVVGGGGAAAAEESGGGSAEEVSAGSRLVLRFEGRSRGVLWKNDVEVLYCVRCPE